MIRPIDSPFGFCADCGSRADGWLSAGLRRVPLCLDCLIARKQGRPRRRWLHLAAGVACAVIAVALWLLAWAVL